MLTVAAPEEDSVDLMDGKALHLLLVALLFGSEAFFKDFLLVEKNESNDDCCFFLAGLFVLCFLDSTNGFSDFELRFLEQGAMAKMGGPTATAIVLC